MTSPSSRIYWKSFTIGIGVTYFAALFIAAPVIRRDAKPPLADEWRTIEIETARFYSEHAEMPNSTEYLPESIRNLIGKDGTGITWDTTKQTYTYTYPRSYPLSIPMIRVFTLGLIAGHSPRVLGSSIGPEATRHNTPLYKAAGYFDTH